MYSYFHHNNDGWKDKVKIEEERTKFHVQRQYRLINRREKAAYRRCEIFIFFFLRCGYNNNNPTFVTLTTQCAGDF